VENSGVVELFLALGIVIAAAQIGGAAARVLGQPRVFGKLVAGVLLGPSLLNFVDWPVFKYPEHVSAAIGDFAELGVLFLMFNVGLEVQLRELLAVRGVALRAGVLGAVVPVALGMPVGLAFDYSARTALFAGVVLAATSVSISAQTLLELGVLRTKEGFGLLATAVTDDIIAILLLSLVIATLGPDTDASAGELIWIVVRMALYLAGALALAWFGLPILFNWIHHHRHLAPRTAAFALIAALIFGWSADALGGVAGITGAFIAGMGLSRTNERAKHEIEAAVYNLSYMFLVPIFFVHVGLLTNLRQIDLDVLPFTGLLLVAAVVAKVGGCGVGARLGGFTGGESLRLGVCMISRGEVGLIIASLGLAQGLLNDEIFQPLFVVILLTTVLTPPLVRWTFRGHETLRESQLVEETAQP
jgi:Kef-type K+ transport system membrane component KefB